MFYLCSLHPELSEEFLFDNEEVQEGDLVLARQEYGDGLAARPVVATFRRMAPSLVTIKAIGPDQREQEVKCTSEHPFWVDKRESIAKEPVSATNGEWVPAKDLKAGDRLAGLGEQSWTVTSSTEEVLEEWLPVYNMTVDVDRTYFVASTISSEAFFLAHNANYKSATVGTSTTTDYRKTFFSAYPKTKSDTIVHHAIEQQVLEKYPGRFTLSENLSSNWLIA